MSVEMLIHLAMNMFYEYLGFLSNGEVLQADMVLVNEATRALESSGEGNQQASVAAYRLAEVAEGAPLLAEELVRMFNHLGEALMLR
jgi:hypothetical protein